MKKNIEFEDEKTLSFQEIIEKEILMVNRNRFMTDEEKNKKIRQLKSVKEYQ